jgi:nitrous oxidase accessory protein NosD
MMVRLRAAAIRWLRPALIASGCGFILALLSGAPFNAANAQESLDALGEYVRDLEPGVWREIPDTSITSVLVTPEGSPLGAWGRGGSRMVLGGPNGAAFDGQRFYVMGGGETRYGGNEIYVFDLATLQWSRLTDPSDPRGLGDGQAQCAGYGRDLFGNQFPPSVMVHDGLVYYPLDHALYLWGTNAYCHDGNGGGPAQAWRFDLTDERWEWIEMGFKEAGPLATAVDEDGYIVLVGRDQAALFDPLGNQFVTEPPEEQFRGTASNAIADPDFLRQQMIVGLGGDLVTVSLGRPLGTPEIRRRSWQIPSPRRVGGIGMAFHPIRDKVVMWPGGREILTVNPETWEFTRYLNEEGPAPTLGDAGLRTKYVGVYSKWAYVREHDVFVGFANQEEGIWLYKLPEADKAASQPAPAPTIEGDIRVCPPWQFSEEWCDHTEVRRALEDAESASRIVLAPGDYYQAFGVNVPGVTIVGEPGAHLGYRAFQGKAAIVVTAPEVTIEGLECSNVSVSDGNGACIRIEAPNFTARNLHIHDSDQGILGGTGGTILIEGSTIEGNGKDGQAHGIYILADVETLIFRNNRVLSTTGLGHGVKSRAQESIITNNVIAGLDATDSRAIDLPQGGRVTIKGNLFQKGPESDNADMIGIAREYRQVAPHRRNATLIENNIFIFDRSGGRLLTSNSKGEIFLRDNVIVNAQRIGASVKESGNTEFSDRGEAGFGAFPELPSLP